MNNDAPTLEDILTDALLDIAEILSSGDVNTADLNPLVTNLVIGPWAPADNDFELSDPDPDPSFLITLQRAWRFSPTDPLAQLTAIEQIRDAYRMVRRDHDLEIISYLPADTHLHNPYAPGTHHHRLWDQGYSLEGIRLGLAALDAAGWSVTADTEDLDDASSHLTLEHTASLAVVGRDEENDDCDYFLRLDLSAEQVVEVFGRVADGIAPSAALIEVTGSARVALLD